MSRVSQKSREYVTHMIDSRKWDTYAPERGDVVISTAYKSGTIWMQNIVLRLLHNNQDVPPVSYSSPWIDGFYMDQEKIDAVFAGQAGKRRCIKTHLNPTALDLYDEVRYVVIGRDPRDVFMSFYDHYSSLTDGALAHIAHLSGIELPKAPADRLTCWRQWISQGAFEFEQEGYPWWGYMQHMSEWWQKRQLDNVHFVHYNDLSADTLGQIRTLNTFLATGCDESTLVQIAQDVAFDKLKQKPDNSLPMPVAEAHKSFVNGASGIFNKGTNRRWEGVIQGEDLALYHEKKALVLPTDCIQWLEQGTQAGQKAA